MTNPNQHSQKTLMSNSSTVQRKWHLVDAKDKTLGRLATKVSSILKGKNKTNYTPHVDNGDYVIVINAAQIHLTGKKWFQKLYYKHSGYPGGLTKVNATEMMKKFPTRMVEKAILGMIPHTKLGSQIGKKLFVYPQADHNHQAQKPEILEV
ncbi:50S ribosomal protein L13 [Candidatus Phytoplasma solani]|uniref:Large ribosomal subunit protein uL13 n=1 Tax=Candidatus Phytoplasma solani TaxID=69896 RepID=A0A421NUL2_9MOLU|nr:50S ribosomal protein L13 [Candidatus Phytoplasma solani]RMI87717.1 50S ribosomal protein L13 [Candidatus Phytoplasma solani]